MFVAVIMKRLPKINIKITHLDFKFNKFATNALIKALVAFLWTFNHQQIYFKIILIELRAFFYHKHYLANLLLNQPQGKLIFE